MCGDDTVCDVYGRDPMEKAKLIADLLNKHDAAQGFPVNQRTRSKTMDNCKFQVGQTYKTRDGREAKVVAVVPNAKDGFGIAAVCEGLLFCCLYDGRRQTIGESGRDLLPNKRTVYVNFFSEKHSDPVWANVYLSESDADAGFMHSERIGNRAYPVEIDE
jgi:hypothetical protein